MDGLQDDTGDGSMLCTEHPFKNNTPAGGICAFCLQEKLGKLVSSSFPVAVFPSSSSPSPSFRSDIAGNSNSSSRKSTIATTTTTTAGGSAAAAMLVPTRLTNSASLLGSNTTNDCRHHQYHSNRSRILYLLGQKKKKKKDLNVIVDGVGAVHDRNKNLVFRRSKSTATPRMRYMDQNESNLNTARNKRGFWSFFYTQKQSHSSLSSTKTLRDISSNSLCASATSSFQRPRQERDIIMVEEVIQENESPCPPATFDRKVSRSRSVGCGSRSFSGDFFERISTGFGDCTLRRVESQREGKPKVSTGGRDCIQERVRCGGLFSGFMITSSSSSSSSSSNWVGSNPNEGTTGSNCNTTVKAPSAVAGTAGTTVTAAQHSRSKSWGWALASPMRAFSKPSSSSKKEASKKDPTPNLAAIPSLLSVRS